MAQSPVTSALEGPSRVGSTEMPGNAQCWGGALPTSIQHGTEVWMPGRQTILEHVIRLWRNLLA